jgi:hypothetical protein
MSESADQVSQLVANAQAQLKRRSERLLHLFSFVTDDKLDWAPSATARSSIRIVAHCANVCEFSAKGITGKLPEQMPSVEDFFKVQTEVEKGVTTRENAIAFLNEGVASLNEALASVTLENIDSMINSPFGLLPMRFWISLGEDQLASHTGQIEYLQTIWGDMDSHMA